MSSQDDSFTIPDEALLADFLAGRCTTAEHERVEEWIAAESWRRESLVSLRYAALYPEQRPAPEDTDRLREGFWARVDALPTHSRPRVAQPSFVRHAAYVVVAALMIVATPVIWRMSQRLNPRPSSVALKEFHTTAGERVRLTFPDGSTIVLAPESRIRYAANFGSKTTRAIMLDGQALFTVTHSAGSPFTVNTGGIVTRVLGTSFAVRRYTTDTVAKIVVAQGRVALGPEVLASGDVGIATTATQVAVTRNTTIGDQLSWAEGRLVFYEVPLRDVIPELERWYGLTVEVTDPALLRRKIRTTIDTESASEAIQLVAISASAAAVIDGHHAVIRQR